MKNKGSKIPRKFPGSGFVTGSVTFVGRDALNMEDK
jgi:hypothetical protein